MGLRRSIGNILRKFVVEDGNKFDVGNPVYDVDFYKDKDRRCLEICRFIHAIVWRNWIDEDSYLVKRFESRKPIRITIPDGAKELDTYLVPVINRNGKIIHLWNATAKEAGSGAVYLAFLSMDDDNRNIRFEDALDREENEEVTKEFLKLFERFYAAYHPPKQQKLESSSSNQVKKMIATGVNAMERITKEEDYLENKAENDDKVFGIISSYVKSVQWTDGTIIKELVKTAYRLIYGVEEHEIPKEVPLFYCLDTIPDDVLPEALADIYINVAKNYFSEEREKAKEKARQQQAEEEIDREIALEEARERRIAEKAAKQAEAQKEKEALKREKEKILAERRGETPSDEQPEVKSGAGNSDSTKPKGKGKGKKGKNKGDGKEQQKQPAPGGEPPVVPDNGQVPEAQPVPQSQPYFMPVGPGQYPMQAVSAPYVGQPVYGQFGRLVSPPWQGQACMPPSDFGQPGQPGAFQPDFGDFGQAGTPFQEIKLEPAPELELGQPPVYTPVTTQGEVTKTGHELVNAMLVNGISIHSIPVAIDQHLSNRFTLAEAMAALIADGKVAETRIKEILDPLYA